LNSANITSNGHSTLDEAASIFLGTLSDEEKEVSQQEVFKFVRWYGGSHLFDELTAPEVANYAERLSASDTDYGRKLELIRAFLSYGKKEGWSKTNLATHLKASKKGVKSSSPSSSSVNHSGLKPVYLTKEGYATLKTDLSNLKKRRTEVTEDMRRAAADKDFRENAPLHAAREQKSYLEGQIKDAETTLKAAVVIEETHKEPNRTHVGDTVLLCEVSSGEEVRYTIVSAREADPAKGRISNTSPLGKAVLGHCEEESVEIVVPIGRLRYQIKKIER
jgi:transcription elongation factor GreA